MALDTPDAADARPDLHHISRIDIVATVQHPRRHPTHGWQVRARRDGERVSKFFADAKHGGSDDALAAAIAHRDRLLASLPDEPTKPRKAWSNTGVVGLSVREKGEGDDVRRSVQINWIDANGKRRAGSFSAGKWGLRRSLWNGCLRLYRERKAAGYPVEEPEVMFARAQEPFADLITDEIQAIEAQAEQEQPQVEPRPEPQRPSPRIFTSRADQDAHEAAAVRKLEEALFG